jgi:endonuclease/exonuclease/phosphatase family metal-dependent hydrolase
MESGPGSVDQVEELARLCGFARFAAGENYSFGWPFLRIRSGNALLSRFPIDALETEQLPGGRPFWEPTNNRRVLWCDVEIDNRRYLAGSVRDDSFDLVNNLAQTRVLLERAGGRPTILAGDFNAEPGSEPISALRSSGRFVFAADGEPTWPASAPRRRIDHVFAPLGWELLEHRTVAIGESDHLAVLAAFRLPPTSAPR